MSARELNTGSASGPAHAVEHLLLGPREHGVTRHGAALAGVWQTTLPRVGPHASALARVLDVSRDNGSCAPVHIHLTEALLADDDAGEEHVAIEEGIAVIEAARRPVHLTLHDVPQPAEGEARYTRRRALYARLIAAAASVQVCSAAERSMLHDAIGASVDSVGVVSLPVDLRPASSKAGEMVAALADDAPVGVLGFVHPGKNLGLALDVAAAVSRDLMLLGEVVAGHESYVAELRNDARARGVDLRVLGHLSEDEMDAAIATVAVPLAAYRHISASGSIGRWIAAGRRPLTIATPWVRELAARAPGVVTVVDPGSHDDAVEGVSSDDAVRGRLIDAARQALADPASTVIDRAAGAEGVAGLTTTAEAAERQARLLAGAMGELR